MDFGAAWEEAQRCLLCEDAPCRGGCPARVDPRTFIRKLRLADVAGAARHLRRYNILAGTSAEICPSTRLCAGECLRAGLTRPIDISALQRFVCQWERESRELTVARVTLWRERVAVVGAGPAGLACAAELAQRGFAVTVFDREPQAGGLLRSVVPAFRLPAAALDHDVSLIEALGVEFRLGHEVTSIDELEHEGFEAFFVAPGTGRSAGLGISGEEHPRVHEALDLLRRVKAGEAHGLGERVAVIGGGDTALDAARVARRAGCTVTLLYRRSRADMPAYADDLQAAWGEGIEFAFRVVPLSIVVRGQDRIAGVRLQRVRWSAGGRLAHQFETEGEPLLFPCDDIVIATGLRPAATLGLALDERGLIAAGDADSATHRRGVFAGGDAATGPGTAVAAVGAGRCAAEAIEAYLVDSKHAAAAETPRRELYRLPQVDLAVTFCGIRFANPFVLAAGPSTDDLEMLRDALRAGWAGAVLKTTSIEGTPVPLAFPLMSAVEFEGRRMAGLGNIDLISAHHIDEVESRVRTLKREFPDRVIAISIMGAAREDWESLARRAVAAGADLIECSFSCPQGTLGSRPGAMLGQDPALVRSVAGWVKAAAGPVPVVIKITPQVADIVEIAQAVRAAGCDAICASNSVPALMGIDLETWVPQPDVRGVSTYSGLSGPAVKPITLRTIAEIARRVGIPITGTGGPTTWRDAAEFMLVGATTVQFCTAVMRYGYALAEDLCEGLAHYLDRRGLRSPADLVGRALPRIVTHEDLPRGQRVLARIDPATCIRDGACVIACRDGGHRAITANETRLPVIDEERCVGCGLCRLVCPVTDCIRMEVGEG